MHCAHLRKESPFYDLFAHGMAPIISFMPSRVTLEGSDETEVYFLDWKACTRDQQVAICQRIVETLGRGTAREVWEHAEAAGIPIRASQVSATSTDVLWFL
jgi:hypothetical protein